MCLVWVYLLDVFCELFDVALMCLLGECGFGVGLFSCLESLFPVDCSL